MIFVFRNFTPEPKGFILMKPKDYRLQTVLKMREKARDEAGRGVARRLVELQEAQNELNRRQNDLLACYEKQDQKQSAMNEMLECGTRVRNVIQHRAFLDHLRESEQQLKEFAEKQKKSVLRAESDLDAARDKLIEATRDFRAIETHRSKWAATVRTATARREQKASDEIGGILHGRRERK
jgi:flagellar export protein FliJ